MQERWSNFVLFFFQMKPQNIIHPPNLTYK
ncbi:unnamed protein product [Nezara viridula]|uniref:Uncharacterized protein n=1 Tax=Nezara viridula TaxID=85310 RepID=A0A9P0H1V5_NEZVI|nr:unnamed protein product [Nezara viridula]